MLSCHVSCIVTPFTYTLYNLDMGQTVMHVIVHLYMEVRSMVYLGLMSSSNIIRHVWFIHVGLHPHSFGCPS